MHKSMLVLGSLMLFGAAACTSESTVQTSQKTQAPSEQPEKTMNNDSTDNVNDGDWSDGDTIPSGMDGVPEIQILQVHKNGSGDVCGSGRSASLKYKAMQANGNVLDPGRAPFTFKVGAGEAIKGWDVVVARMRIGDSFTILLPQALAYGPSKGDLKFDMELLSIK
jgi:FKBP-type peptidyl-prolyl cis-trans isomerase